ncbi:MAG: hypothetical protein FWG55_00495 [Candidatus Bathyarchaeota archaeon]|nr:hypothetical protein [Candidatus Termiticorpusculum sp.]
MVKFQEYFVIKRSKFERRPYKYRGILLRVPKKFHNKIAPFIGVDLTVKDLIVSEFNGGHTITIMLSTVIMPQKSGRELINQLSAKMN